MYLAPPEAAEIKLLPSQADNQKPLSWLEPSAIVKLLESKTIVLFAAAGVYDAFINS